MTAPADSTVFPPGPWGAPPLGHLLAFRRDTLGFMHRSSQESTLRPRYGMRMRVERR